jgi:DNA-binding transcriptional LysR family regulator
MPRLNTYHSASVLWDAEQSNGPHRRYEGFRRDARRRQPRWLAAGERSAPRGTLTLTAPVTSGERVLRPILDAFLDAYPTVSARLYLLDRPVNLIDEGIDVALRIAAPALGGNSMITDGFRT